MAITKTAGAVLSVPSRAARGRLAVAGAVAIILATLAAPASAAEVAFRGVLTASTSSVSITVGVPGGSVAGDVLVLFVSGSRSDFSLATPVGWEELGHAASGTMQTAAWHRIADGTSNVTVRASGAMKLDAQLLAYGGPGDSTAVWGHDVATASGSSAELTTPTVAGTPSGSWVLSYWANKTNDATGWTPPSTVVERAQSIGGGNGRITSVTADSGQGVSAGTVGGITAESSASSNKATMWTVVLNAEDGGEPPPPPPPPPDDEVTRWEMNEPSGATTMVATGGLGPDGAIGSAVVPGFAVGNVMAYSWGYVRPNDPPPKPERLVVIDEDNRLDPGSGIFEVTFRMRSTRNFGNIMQKGQSRTPGGYWKFQFPQGVVGCLFRDGNGNSAGVSAAWAINDGQWHVVACRRTPTAVMMSIDGVVHGRNNKSTGSINNIKPVTIGGKSECDQETVTCDYFQGEIDWVQISRV